MGKRNNKGSSKKSKLKNHKGRKNEDNIYIKEAQNAKKIEDEVYMETILQDSEEDVSNVNIDSSTTKTSSDTSSTTNTDTSDNNADTNINDCCEEIKEKQQELFNKLKKLNEALIAITSIRDDVNSLRVDTLTEIYFTRQVRPLLDALNIISFASTNISSTATAFQTSALGETKEIKNALKLSYKMNDEVEDIINALGRRLTIFLKQIDNMDKNCPPFDLWKDS
jgi:hypothetical protein